MNDFLIHYGIKGQKWGIRNYQNEDGTLTAAGKERYSDASREYKKEARKLDRLANNADINRQKGIQKTQIKKAKQELTKAAVALGTAAITGKMAETGTQRTENRVWWGGTSEDYANFRKQVATETAINSLNTKLSNAFSVGWKISAGKGTYHAIRAAVATYKIKEIEKGVASIKYRQQVSNMTERFANTPYSELLNNKIAKNKERGIE